MKKKIKKTVSKKPSLEGMPFDEALKRIVRVKPVQQKRFIRKKV